jgi:hypothetical protein
MNGRKGWRKEGKEGRKVIEGRKEGRMLKEGREEGWMEGY